MKTTARIYTVFAPDDDMTFIMRDIIYEEVPISTEIVSWHYGTPEIDDIKNPTRFSLKAQFV